MSCFQTEILLITFIDTSAIIKYWPHERTNTGTSWNWQQYWIGKLISRPHSNSVGSHLPHPLNNYNGWLLFWIISISLLLLLQLFYLHWWHVYHSLHDLHVLYSSICMNNKWLKRFEWLICHSWLALMTKINCPNVPLLLVWLMMGWRRCLKVTLLAEMYTENCSCQWGASVTVKRGPP